MGIEDGRVFDAGDFKLDLPSDNLAGVAIRAEPVGVTDDGALASRAAAP